MDVTRTGSDAAPWYDIHHLSVVSCQAKIKGERPCPNRALFLPASLGQTGGEDIEGSYCYEHLDRYNLTQDHWKKAFQDYVQDRHVLNYVSLSHAIISPPPGSPSGTFKFEPMTRFELVSFERSRFYLADLRACVFSDKCRLDHTHFTDCNLDQAAFLCSLSHTHFVRCELANASFLPTVEPPKIGVIRNCAFTDVKFRDCKFQKTLILNVDMTGCMMDHATAKGISIIGGTFVNMDFSEVNPLREAELIRGIEIRDVTLPTSFRDQYDSLCSQGFVRGMNVIWKDVETKVHPRNDDAVLIAGIHGRIQELQASEFVEELERYRTADGPGALDRAQGFMAYAAIPFCVCALASLVGLPSGVVSILGVATLLFCIFALYKMRVSASK